MTKQLAEKIRFCLKCINELNARERNGVHYTADLEEEIGNGMMGHIFNITGPHLTEEAVMKVISLNDYFAENNIKTSGNNHEGYYKKMLEYCHSEMELLKSLNESPYITKYIDGYVFEEENVFIIIMKKYECLENLVINQTITEANIIKLGKNILGALIELKKRHIIHRDIKPANIYCEVSEEGNHKFVLGDFGSARKLFASGFGQVTVIGTEQYMAPEIRYGYNINYEKDTSDLFLLAATMYTILSGGDTVNTYTREGKVPKLNCKNKQLADIVMKALSYNPQDRYSNPEEMLYALEQLNPLDSCRDVIHFNKYVYAAKNKIEMGEIEDAVNLLKIGIKSENKRQTACKRLYFYLRLRQGKLSKSDSKELKVLADDYIDPAAQCLYGVHLCEDQGDREEGEKYIKKSAENGSVIGNFLYGRILYREGRREGIKYCENAAREGLVPAICYLKKIRRKNAGYIPDDKLLRLMDGTDSESYELDRAAFYVPYL